MDWSVTINFHPDRLVADGSETLIECLAHDRVWRSQFETGTSNGGLTAQQGGDRWRWERRMFGGRYDAAPPHERPRYGALNHRRRAVGGAVRFGSAHLRLRPHVLARTTFCYPDSSAEPEHFAASDPAPLVALADADTAVGVHDLLDDYVEAQVHGTITLPDDVDAIVLDPSYRSTPVADAARALGVGVEWHHGLRLHADELATRPGFRGPGIVDVARAVAVGHTTDGWLDARVIGEAALAGERDPQDLKKVWHHVARWGYAW
jgi:hypothetical protein